MSRAVGNNSVGTIRRGQRSHAVVTSCVLAASLLFARIVSRKIGQRIFKPVHRRAPAGDGGGAAKNCRLPAGACGKTLDQNEDIRRHQRDLRELADAMPQLLWSVLADGSTGYANRRLLEYVGIAPGDARSWTWGIGLHPLDREACVRGWNEALRTGSPYEAECRIRRAADGSYRWHLARAVPVRGHDECIVRWLATCTDIDALKQAQNDTRERNALLEERMAERTEQAAAAHKELDALSYSVSHDLRAPLRAIDGFSRILQEDYGDKLDDEGRRLIGVVRNGSHELGRLIDELLAFSRLGRSEISVSHVDMTALVRTLLEEMRREKGSLPEVTLRPLPPARGDAALMRQVWINLLSNALKFSAKARNPRIEVGGEREAETNVYFVRDNGVGFDMKYADKLFGVFQRLHRSEDYPGTGVGLAIVQRLVRKHGGKVWAQGALGEGATFFFSLPANGPSVPVRDTAADPVSARTH